MANFDEAFANVLTEEGGSKYTEIKGDKGGATKYGISQRAYPNVNIKELTLKQAAGIYKTDYWDKVKGDLIASQKVAESIFDCAVNLGVSRASKFAQQCSKCEADGIVGPRTVASINMCSPESFLQEFKARRVARYHQIVAQDATQEKFINGWLARAARYV